MSALHARQYLAEVGSMLGWRGYRGVAMLLAMMDESYQHDGATGHAVKMTVGGCVASYAAWEAFSAEWAQALSDFDLSMFHMTDFEANEGAFKGWENDQSKRRKLLGRLLDILTAHTTIYIGAGADVDHPGGQTRGTYQKLVTDTIKGVARDGDYRKGEKLALVFARHKDLSLDKGEAYKAVMEETDPVYGPITLDDPISMCPLQAADIVVYELSRAMRPGRDPEARYPFRRLRDAARAAGTPFRVSFRP